MLLLALDTSTSAITVALHDGQQVLSSATTIDARAHAEQVAPGIRAVLAEAGRAADEVTEVVVGRGPGPFTGLRVGVVTALVFAAVRDIPVAGVCSLDVLASQALAQAPDRCAGGLVVATDARRREVYWARYRPAGEPPGDGAADPVVPAGPDVRDDSPQPPAPVGPLWRVDGPRVGPAHRVAQEVGGLPVVGRGGLLYPESFGASLGPLDVCAGALAELAVWRSALGCSPEPATPMYLRRPDAQPSGPPKRVSR